jgi:hypothetical protein
VPTEPAAESSDKPEADDLQGWVNDENEGPGPEETGGEESSI